MEWQVKQSSETEVENRNSSQSVGAERRAVRTKITSPSQDAWYANPTRVHIPGRGEKASRWRLHSTDKHRISPYVFLLYFRFAAKSRNKEQACLLSTSSPRIIATKVCLLNSDQEALMADKLQCVNETNPKTWLQSVFSHMSNYIWHYISAMVCPLEHEWDACSPQQSQLSCSDVLIQASKVFASPLIPSR